MGIGKLVDSMAQGTSPEGGVPSGNGLQREPQKTPVPVHQSFGDRLGDLFKERFPVAGGLAGMIGGHNTAATQGMPVPENGLPPIQMPTQDLPDYSAQMQQNAQPKSGGGLQALLKLFMGG
jgi:hypothetical protein